jgi:hypothetical protein
MPTRINTGPEDLWDRFCKGPSLCRKQLGQSVISVTDQDLISGSLKQRPRDKTSPQKWVDLHCLFCFLFVTSMYGLLLLRHSLNDLVDIIRPVRATMFGHDDLCKSIYQSFALGFCGPRSVSCMSSGRWRITNRSTTGGEWDFSYPKVDPATWMTVTAHGDVLHSDGSICDSLATAKLNDAAQGSGRGT